MHVEAELTRSRAVVVGVTGRVIEDAPYRTSTRLSPAFTAEIGASNVGCTGEGNLGGGEEGACTGGDLGG